jgi:hypothetical protein
MERNSDAMRTTGKLFFLAGGGLSIVGTFMLIHVETTHCFFEAGASPTAPASVPASTGSLERVRSSSQALNGCDTSPVPAVGVLVAGVLTAVAGIPLFMIGSKQVPAGGRTGKLIPQVSIGAASGSLRWSF